MREEVSAHWWVLEEPPGGATVWPVLVGHLIGKGALLRANQHNWLGPHLVVKGQGTLKSSTGRYKLVAGDMFMLWPGISHEYWEDPDDPIEFYWVRILGPGGPQLGREWGASPEKPVIRPAVPEMAGESIKALHTYWGRENRDPHEGLSLLHRFIAASKPASRNRPASQQTPRDLVLQAGVIAETFLETGLNVAELAGHLGISRTKLWRAFLEETGSSPLHFLREKRLKRAQSLLRHTDLKIREISRTCGFSSEKYLHQMFKSVLGTTPGQWRRGP